MVLYFFRLILLLIWGAISSLYGLVLVLLRPFHPNNSYLFSRCFGPMAAKIMGVKITLRQSQHLYLHKPCIFISNHQHNFDLISGCNIVGPYTVSIGKHSLLYIPLFGLFYYMAGNILVNRTNHHKAMQSMKKVKKALKENNTSIWIMPEGTRNKSNQLKVFKKGAFATACEVGCPIVPVAFSSYKGHLNFKNIRSGQIIIEAMDAIEKRADEDVSAFAQRARDLIAAKIASLDSEL